MRRALALATLLAGCGGGLEEVKVDSRIRVYTVGDCSELSWPVDAPLSSPFGVRDGRPHLGIDLAVPEGTPVHAACDGVVAYAGAKLRGYGNLVILAHGLLATVYAHNSALLVREGEKVLRGSLIARSGATGHVTAPHLHFEVRRDGKATDPLEYLPHGQPNRVAQREDPRRARLPQAGHPVQGRDAVARSRSVLPALH
jgi:murein DD-endopeptidase MepM/ murein hydrolase activator NlpD